MTFEIIRAFGWNVGFKHRRSLSKDSQNESRPGGRVAGILDFPIKRIDYVKNIFAVESMGVREQLVYDHQDLEEGISWLWSLYLQEIGHKGSIMLKHE